VSISELSTAGLGVVVAILSFWIKRYMDENDEMHSEHRRHAANMELHQTERDRQSSERERQGIADELVRHTKRDDERFDTFDKKIDGIAGDIKAILRAVGK